MNVNLYRDLTAPVRARGWDARNRAEATATSASPAARDHAIDIVDALDLLDRCVRERGEGYRKPRRHLRAISCTVGDDAFPSATDGIVTLALSKAGAPRAALRALAHESLADLYASGRCPFNLTLGAVVVFRAAEAAERRGQTWLMGLQAAVAAASRFVVLIPDGLADSGARFWPPAG
ncbi:MAG: hypothetical protein JWN95_2869 [Frankiales bacterium]|nr:hypothetical protein [Frankiales bacterium]